MFIYCEFENFCEFFFCENFAYAKVREKLNPREMPKSLCRLLIYVYHAVNREYLDSQICLLTLFAKIKFARKFQD